MEGVKDQMVEPPWKSPSSWALPVPPEPVRAMRGKKAARAAPMLALAALRACSAACTSGRSTSTSDGTSASQAAMMPVPSNGPAGGTSGGMAPPTSTCRALRARSRCCSSWARVARAASTCASAVARSRSLTRPDSVARLTRWREESSASRVDLARVACSSSARTVRSAVATSATREICRLRWASSVARNCSSAASERLFTRPKRSSSKEARPRPTVQVSPTTALPTVLRSAGTRWRVTAPPAVIMGSRWARWIWYWPRTWSTLAAAARRSRLRSRATPMSPWRRASGKTLRQPSAEAGTAGLAGWAPGAVRLRTGPAMGGPGRW